MVHFKTGKPDIYPVDACHNVTTEQKWNKPCGNTPHDFCLTGIVGDMRRRLLSYTCRWHGTNRPSVMEEAILTSHKVQQDDGGDQRRGFCRGESKVIDQAISTLFAQILLHEGDPG